MQIIHLTTQAPVSLPPIALTIGNYDGVHLGHQAMLQMLTTQAKAHDLAAAVMVFEPQPKEFLYPDMPPARLSGLSEKAEMMAKLGMDYLLVAGFDDKFRSLSANEFTKLLTKLNARHLVLGDDFRFGHDRLGDGEFLKQAGFEISYLPTTQIIGERVSSTAVREALANHDFAKAKAFLGRDYAITGEVVHGDKIGRTLNFATANVALNRPKPALLGVYGADVFAFKDGQAVDLSSLGEQAGVSGVVQGSLFGAVNVGMRPSVCGQEYRLEVHLPNFAADLYGMTLTVVFRTFLHGEKKYANLEELKQGIAQDVVDLLAWRSKLG